jgi:hypothetical protein
VKVTWKDIKLHKFIYSSGFIHVHSPRETIQIGNIISFLLVCSTGVWNEDPHLEPLEQPYFCDWLFWDRDSWIICQGWHGTLILLISASWVARIIGVSHRHTAEISFLIAVKAFKAREIWCHVTIFTYTSCKGNSACLLKVGKNFIQFRLNGSRSGWGRKQGNCDRNASWCFAWIIKVAMVMTVIC